MTGARFRVWDVWREGSPPVLAVTTSTPIGPLTLLAHDGVVLAAGFADDVGALLARLPRTPRVPDAPPPTHGPTALDPGAIVDALDAYFVGGLGALDAIPVAQPGGPFQQRVWSALRALPPGRPTTYRQLAARLGEERLARAVGMGCATNLIAPIVPCHRLTRSDGALAGYLWGLERKRWLLDHERRHAAAGAPPGPLAARSNRPAP